jgi:hypothetical protein
MIAGGIVGYTIGLMTEGALVGVGFFVLIVLWRESQGRKKDR